MALESYRGKHYFIENQEEIYQWQAIRWDGKEAKGWAYSERAAKKAAEKYIDLNYDKL